MSKVPQTTNKMDLEANKNEDNKNIDEDYDEVSKNSVSPFL